MEQKELLNAIKAMMEDQNKEVMGHLAAMQADITTIKEDIKALDVKLDSNTAELKQEIAELRTEMEEGFKATRLEIVEVVERVGRKVERLEGSVKDVETVTARNAFELQLIKGKA